MSMGSIPALESLFPPVALNCLARNSLKAPSGNESELIEPRWARTYCISSVDEPSAFWSVSEQSQKLHCVKTPAKFHVKDTGEHAHSVIFFFGNK